MSISLYIYYNIYYNIYSQDHNTCILFQDLIKSILCFAKIGVFHIFYSFNLGKNVTFSKSWKNMEKTVKIHEKHPKIHEKHPKTMIFKFAFFQSRKIIFWKKTSWIFQTDIYKCPFLNGGTSFFEIYFS